MCGRLVFLKYYHDDGSYDFYKVFVGKEAAQDDEKIRKIFMAANRYDIRPTQKVDVIYSDSKQATAFQMKWGWQPSWSKTPLINARSEKLIESKVWQKALRERRCIVPASHFYEWQDRGGTKNIPWLIKRKDHEYLFFAGLWTKGKDKKTGEDIGEVTIITQAGNDLMCEIHNHGGNRGRQPVFLDDEKIPAWLDSSMNEPELAMSILRQIENGEYEAVMLDAIGDDKTHTPPKLAGEKEKDDLFS